MGGRGEGHPGPTPHAFHGCAMHRRSHGSPGHPGLPRGAFTGCHYGYSAREEQEAQKSPYRVNDDDEDFIMEDDTGGGEMDIIEEDSQELIEAAVIAEAQKTSAKARARPES